MIKQDYPLQSLNTFHINIHAKYFASISNEQDLLEIIQSETFKTNKHLILGKGANILFTKDFEGLIIKSEILGKEIVYQDDSVVDIKVGSGEDRNDFVFRCIDHNYVGIENLVSIPSSIGASAVGNIGAYGAEAKDIIKEVIGYHIDLKEQKTLSNSECKFSYRNSIFKNELKDKFIVTHVVFRLKKVSEYYRPNILYKDILKVIEERKLDEENIDIKTLADIIVNIRAQRLPDPEKIGTAGSFFKNPIINISSFNKLHETYPDIHGFPNEKGEVKLAAGQLIELAGLKGYRDGDAGISPDHALILLNYGHASGSDILNLSNYIISQVKEKFEVTLEPEVIII